MNMKVTWKIIQFLVKGLMNQNRKEINQNTVERKATSEVYRTRTERFIEPAYEEEAAKPTVIRREIQHCYLS